MFPGRLGLRFFYLNAGRPAAPGWPRVEIPAWVEENAEMIDQLQAVLVEQAQIMGSTALSPIFCTARMRSRWLPTKSADQVEELAGRRVDPPRSAGR
jgi:hypothetical protein